MDAIIPVLVGAVVTAVLGNFLVQKWQLRSWREQQRHLGHQAELEEMKSLLAEITSRAASRHNAMRRLIGSLAPQSRGNFEEALSDYRSELAAWNAALNSLFVRIRLAMSYAETVRFERDIHALFVDAGVSIEQVIRARESGVQPNWSDLIDPKEKLNRLQGQLFSFLRDLADTVEARKEEIYFGKKLSYSKDNLEEYSLLELVKALFSADVDGFYVVRSA